MSIGAARGGVLAPVQASGWQPIAVPNYSFEAVSLPNVDDFDGTQQGRDPWYTSNGDYSSDGVVHPGDTYVAGGALDGTNVLMLWSLAYQQRVAVNEQMVDGTTYRVTFPVAKRKSVAANPIYHFYLLDSDGGVLVETADTLIDQADIWFEPQLEYTATGGDVGKSFILSVSRVASGTGQLLIDNIIMEKAIL